MKKQYEEPVVEVLVLTDEAIMSSDDHDNNFGDFGDWENL